MDTLKRIMVAFGVAFAIVGVSAVCFFLVSHYLEMEQKYHSITSEREAWELALQRSDVERIQAQSEVTQLQERLAQLESEKNGLYDRIAELESQAQSALEGSETQIRSLQPGDVIVLSEKKLPLDAYFYASPIEYGDAVFQRIDGKSYRENPDIALSDLRYLRLLHYNFQHEVQVGEMIVNRMIAQDTLSVFQELFAAEYEIQSVYLIDNYWTGDGVSTDTNSIEHNNTSCFNYRVVTGGSSLSNHAYGRAIDINPQQNPYVWIESDGSLGWAHGNADPYIDRSSGLPHMVLPGDLCCSIFEKYGFAWGGYWQNPIDYQHFEKES